MSFIWLLLQKQLSTNPESMVCSHCTEKSRLIVTSCLLSTCQAHCCNYPCNYLSPFSPHINFDILSLKLLTVCIHLISLIALPAVLINDVISLVFECPILSGVMNMHTFWLLHSIYAYLTGVIGFHIIWISEGKAYCWIIRTSTLFSALMEWHVFIFLVYFMSFGLWLHHLL